MEQRWRRRNKTPDPITPMTIIAVSVLGSGTEATWNEPLNKAWDLTGTVGSGLSVSNSEKASVPVAPLNIPSPPVIIKVPEAVAVRLAKSIKPLPLSSPYILHLKNLMLKAILNIKTRIRSRLSKIKNRSNCGKQTWNASCAASPQSGKSSVGIDK